VEREATLDRTPRAAAGPRALPDLGPDDVHLWWMPLDEPPTVVAALGPVLSPDESERAARFVFPRHRDRFIVGRAGLRGLLADYLRTKPAEIPLSATEYGKPHLSSRAGALNIRFNVSNAGGLALVGVTLGREIGVDLELVRPERADRRVAQRFFSSRELKDLGALRGEEWVRGFFRCWTRKEAYIKARGEGLSLSLDRFDVSVTARAAAEILAVRPDRGERSRWSMADVSPPGDPAWVAAIVVEGSGWRLREFEAGARTPSPLVSGCANEGGDVDGERANRPG
jgi:4'-phosphopantetheinyl transferase